MVRCLAGSGNGWSDIVHPVRDYDDIFYQQWLLALVLCNIDFFLMTRDFWMWHMHLGKYGDPKAMSRVQIPCTALWFWAA